MQHLNSSPDTQTCWAMSEHYSELGCSIQLYRIRIFCQKPGVATCMYNQTLKDSLNASSFHITTVNFFPNTGWSQFLPVNKFSFPVCEENWTSDLSGGLGSKVILHTLQIRFKWQISSLNETNSSLKLSSCLWKCNLIFNCSPKTFPPLLSSSGIILPSLLL